MFGKKEDYDGRHIVALGMFGLFSMAASGAIGAGLGWRRGRAFCDLAKNIEIKKNEPNLARRYTLPLPLKNHARFSLMYLLAGPAVLSIRHLGHHLYAWNEPSFGKPTLGSTLFIDLLLIPVACSTLAFSFCFGSTFLMRTKLGLTLATIRRIF